MGEAARRKNEIEKLKSRNTDWLNTLSPDERTIADVARATHEKIVVRLGMTEGCYNLAFFLYEHLRRQYGINVKIVVGWINDGTWDGGASHAWIEYEEKKVDVSLTKTSHPDVQPPGDMILLDHVFQKGEATYTYWNELPEEVAAKLTKMAETDPHISFLMAHKDKEHERIKLLSLTQEGVDEYFRQIPEANRYEALARLVG